MNVPKIAMFTTMVWLIMLPGCSEPPAEPPPVVRPVKIVTIGDSGTNQRRELPGTVKAVQHADMGFEVGGRITEFLVNEGQRVTQGTVLARLDARDYQASLDQAQAAFRKARSDLERSERIYAEDPGAISTSKIDTDRKAVEVAEADVRKAEKAVQDAELRAPFDGVVARRLVEDFQNVQPKEPVLVLQDISQLEIEVAVPERDISRGSVKRTPEEITERVQPKVELSSLPGRQFPAAVKEFATTADAATRTFQVRLTFTPPEDASVLPGMTARVTYNASADDGVTLPSHAAFADESGAAHVWLVDAETMKVRKQAVQLGDLTGAEVEILDGLTNGDLVAVSGVGQLREGMEVRRYEN